MKYKKILIYIFLSIGGLSFLFPFYWMLITSLKTQSEAILFPPTLFPKFFVLSNYLDIWKEVPFLTYIFNSFLIAICVVIGVIFSSVMAAYALARMKFPGRNLVFMFLLSIMMIPLPLYLASSYVILYNLHWIDTYLALIIPWTVNVFSIFLLRQHFKQIPNSLYESALIDGCGDFTFLWRIAVPMVKPTLIAIAVFNFISSWNAFLWPLIVTNRDSIRPVQIGLAYFARSEITNYPLLMAGSTISILPLIIIYFVFQRSIINSYTRSGIKE